MPARDLPLACIGTAFLLLSAAPAAATELACEGPFGPDSSAGLLIETFGAENVVTGEVPGPEGSTMLATTVHPDDPERRLQAVWWDEEGLAGLAHLMLPPAYTAPGGVRIGMSVAEVEALNGEPFVVLGFGWDFGGAAGFETGALADLPGGCRLGLTFRETAELPAGADADAIMGDREVRSDLPLLRQVEPKVADMWIGYPHPDYVDD